MERQQKGFTLIELLIVVAIIGILAAVGAAVIPGLLGNAKITATKANLENITSWLSANSAQVCMQGHGMYLDKSVWQTYIKCTDDGTGTAYAASFYFTNNDIFKNPYTGGNAIASKNTSASYNITRNGLINLNSSYIQKGEIMFFNLGGEDMAAVLANVGDKNGRDYLEWQFVPSPRNF